MTDLIFIFWLYYNINIALLTVEYFYSIDQQKSYFTKIAIFILLCNLLGMPCFNLFFIKFHLFLIYFSQYSYFGAVILFWLNVQLYFLYVQWYKLWTSRFNRIFTVQVCKFTRIEAIFIWSFFHSGVNWYFLINAFIKNLLSQC
jgi:hypothetical protein